jgi:YidC/Oxa1 family membrane protein insertase
VTISHEVENLTDQPVKVSVDQMASVDLPAVTGQTDYRFYHAAGFNSAKHAMDPERYNLLHATDLRRLVQDAAGTPTKEIGSFLGDNPLEWVATSDRFFAVITRPAPETGAPAPVVLYANHKLPVQAQVAAANIDVLYAPPSPADAEECVGGIRLTGNPLEIPGHKAGSPPANLSLPLAVYLGPKRPEILKGDINADEKPAPLSPQDQRTYNYAAFEYGKLIQITTSSCGGIYSYCMIDVLAYILLRFLDLIHAVIPNYGVAIMILVLLIKAALHPLTRASQVNMAKMSKKMKDIQPLIEANKKKYAKDKQKQNEEMMRIYREHKVNPAGGLLGCLPMFLQTPIWIAVWGGLSMDINLRHAVFIPGWINDLSAPDATWVFTPFHLPLVGWKISSLNILPLLLGIVVFVQMKVQTASQPKPADDQQANMQKISSYMVLIFPLMLYSWPSGLNLYYFASTLGGLVDTYFVRKSLKRKGILPAKAQALPTHEEKG